MIIGDHIIFIADEKDEDDKVEIGVYLPFGNYEEESLSRDDALAIVRHLSKVFTINNEELKQ